MGSRDENGQSRDHGKQKNALWSLGRLIVSLLADINLSLKMQEEWSKEKRALLTSIKEKEERLKDFEKVRCHQHFHLYLLEHVKCALRSITPSPHPLKDDSSPYCALSRVCLLFFVLSHVHYTTCKTSQLLQ